jgi:hypothetical protein
MIKPHNQPPGHPAKLSAPARTLKSLVLGLSPARWGAVSWSPGPLAR